MNSYDHEIKAKESELSTLKSKLKLVESQVGTISDDKQDLIDKISCLRDDITSLSETKEWFQKQLHSAQEARYAVVVDHLYCGLHEKFNSIYLNVRNVR